MSLFALIAAPLGGARGRRWFWRDWAPGHLTPSSSPCWRSATFGLGSRARRLGGKNFSKKARVSVFSRAAHTYDSIGPRHFTYFARRLVEYVDVQCHVLGRHAGANRFRRRHRGSRHVCCGDNAYQRILELRTAPRFEELTIQVPPDAGLP